MENSADACGLSALESEKNLVRLFSLDYFRKG